MLLVGLTGGIGSGKSTVAALLAGRGATVIDADALARAAVVKGTDAHRRIVDRFGTHVLQSDGELDRGKLAGIVFRDDDARAALDAIVHPEVMRAIADRIESLKESDQVVVLDVPLLVEIGGGEGLDLVVVVDAPEEVRVRRLVEARAMSAEDVRARMAVQASTEQRRALADVVVENAGSVAELEAQVDALWGRIEAMRA